MEIELNTTLISSTEVAGFRAAPFGHTRSSSRFPQADSSRSPTSAIQTLASTSVSVLSVRWCMTPNSLTPASSGTSRRSTTFPTRPSSKSAGRCPHRAALELEEEGVFQASDYPAGSFVFEEVNLNLTTGPPTISWNTSVDPTTNVEVTVDIDGSENAQISIVFPSS